MLSSGASPFVCCRSGNGASRCTSVCSRYCEPEDLSAAITTSCSSGGDRWVSETVFSDSVSYSQSHKRCCCRCRRTGSAGILARKQRMECSYLGLALAFHCCPASCFESCRASGRASAPLGQSWVFALAKESHREQAASYSHTFELHCRMNWAD